MNLEKALDEIVEKNDDEYTVGVNRLKLEKLECNLTNMKKVRGQFSHYAKKKL